jgi:putative membrane protein
MADDASTILAMRRTGMSFQRTRMSADRTLMSVIRTSLSLVGFGFTIYQFFGKLRDSGVIKVANDTTTFGMALVWLGILLLTLGIVYHIQFMLGLRDLRDQMKAEGLLYAQSRFPVSLTLLTALVLLALAVLTIVAMQLHAGPFG